MSAAETAHALLAAWEAGDLDTSKSLLADDFVLTGPTPELVDKAGYLVLQIYDAAGGLVRTLELGHRPAGFYRSRTRAAYWDGTNDAGEPVASGVYFYQLRAGDFSQTRRMVIVK